MTEKRIRQIRMGVVALVLLISGAIYIALPFAAVHFAQAPFIGFLLDPNLISSDAGESHWPAKKLLLPVTYPDRLTAVDGVPVQNLAEYRMLIAEKSFGDNVTLTLQQPRNSRVEPKVDVPAERNVTVPLIALSSSDLWNRFWLFYLVGALMWVFGAWAFRIRPDAEAAQIFALSTSLGAVAVGGLFDLTTTQWFIRFWVIALSLFGSFNLLLVLVFPHEIRLVNRFPRLKWLALLPGILVAIWGEIWLYNSTDLWSYAIAWRAAYFLNGIALALSFGILIFRSFWSPSPLVRQQGRLILVGAALGFTPLLLFFTLASIPIRFSWLTESFYVPPVVIYPFAIAYTIVRYRLLDFDFVWRRSLAHALLTGLLIGVLTLAVSSLRVVLAPFINVNNPILLALLIVAVALVYDPLRNWLQQGLEQTVFRQPVAFDELLRKYNRALTTAVHADQVADMLLTYAHDGVPSTETELYLPDSKMSCYSGYNNSGSFKLDMDSPVVDFLKLQTGVIDLAEERAWPDTFHQNRQTVATMKAAAIVPMNNGQELLGWLTVSPKENKRHFNPLELSYLRSLADQSLIGLERANVIRRLETRIAELDLLSQFSQYLNFTIDFDDLLELTYVNYQRLMGIEDFFVSWRNPDTGDIFTAFYVEKGERVQSREGRDKIVTDPRILEVINTGQMTVQEDENGRFWIIAPLNAGADTLGALHTIYHEPGLKLLRREEQLFGVFADRTAVALDRLQTRNQLEERAQQLEIINQVTMTLASTLELEPLLNLILDKAMELLDTEAGTFMLKVDDTGELEFRVVRGPASEDLLGKRLTIGTGLAGSAAQSGRAVLVNRVQDDKRWFNQVDATTDFHSQSILTVPLLRKSTVLGVVQVINKKNGAPFDEVDQSLLMAFAGQAVVALENARLWEQTDKELQERVSELFMLQQLDRDLNTTLDLDNVLNLTLDWILRICDGSAGAIVLKNGNGDGRPRLRATRGYDKDFDPAVINADALEKGLVGLVLRTGEPHVTGNVHEEKDYVDASFSTHSQMTVPIIHKQQLIGAIAIEGVEFDAFDNATLETAVRVTNHAAVAITNAILYDQVQAANQAKSEFVSMVSHELKTPMTSVGGYTDLMLSGMTGELTEQQRNFLETVSVNIKRMGQLIQDLTDISRIETNHLRVELAPVSFTNVISDTLQIVRGPCDGKSINLHLDLPADLPLVLGDKERLVQVTTNLLSNACKYSPPETDVDVVVRATTMTLKPNQPEQPVVVCSVRDKGYGISKEDLKQLFTKFFRADDPNIRKATGTGLGLSITKGIVELHNGRIWVESELGKGTTFHVAIPQVAQ
ncbi:MAG: GAF domain-containing protein [Ardenticatenaceae bacterium]|nr:GAF domain-containing protein [Ardenticatenaceae bacterium]MCB9446545.1 GAF domain-containing protein [Ardenticatenaceae bacterium]